jgi:rhodanese-related sulfurtransferase
MCQWLLNQGFTQVKNVAGGIDAYSQLIDPTVARY